MNTKLILTTSALVMAVFGGVTTFLPNELLSSSGVPAASPSPVLLQVLGAMYLGAASLNWMSRSVLIGGIYARPLAMFNTIHFTIGVLALGKGLVAHPGSLVLSIAATAYLILAVMFITILRRHPASLDVPTT